MTARSFRTVLFWLHLTSGVTAAAVILLMCVTGVLLTYERQIYAWYDGGYRSQPAPAAAHRLPIEELLSRSTTHLSNTAPASITIAADVDAPVTIAAGERTLFFDAHSGRFLGESRAQRARRLLAAVKAWHRWLGADGGGRAAARAVTGWSNLLFLGLVASGVYLWMPRQWTATRLKAVALFNGALRGRARDFNWHNVVGIWSAVPLFVVVLSAVPMSFPWANALVYRLVGDRVPAVDGRERPRAGREAGDGRNARAAAPVPTFAGLDGLFARAVQQEPNWRTITLRIPATAQTPLAFAIDRGNGAQPHLRSTLTLARDTGDVIGYETFSSQSPGRRLRSILRFAHTGEVLGIGGQTVAGVASAGGAVLVCTGIALAVRRCVSWLSRRRSAAPGRARSAA
jgi:uncharacterized iron-regulated membrane protein